MSAAEEIEIIVRPRRQVTLPSELCQQLGITVGDRLELRVEGQTLIARPKKALARKALGELRQVFAASAVREKELQEYARKVREGLSSEHHEPEA